MVSYALRVLKPSATSSLDRPDVIVGSSVHPFAALSAAVLAWRFRVPFVFEVRDLWPQTLIDLGRLRAHSATAFLLHRLERWLYRRADRIIVLLPKAADYIVPLGIPPEKIVWIPNGIDLHDYPEPTAPTQHATLTLMYLGAHGQANGLETLMEAMALLLQKDDVPAVRLHMIGDGPDKPDLMQMAKSLRLTNVEFMPPIPKKEVPAIASTADAFVICVKDLPRLYRYGISMNKLYEYLAAARPIVIASAAANNPVQEAGAGLTVPPEDPAALAEAICELARMPIAQRASLGAAGRMYVERQHDFRHLAAKLANMLDGLVEQRP